MSTLTPVFIFLPRRFEYFSYHIPNLRHIFISHLGDFSLISLIHFNAKILKIRLESFECYVSLRSKLLIKLYTAFINFLYEFYSSMREGSQSALFRVTKYPIIPSNQSILVLKSQFVIVA